MAKDDKYGAKVADMDMAERTRLAGVAPAVAGAVAVAPVAPFADKGHWLTQLKAAHATWAEVTDSRAAFFRKKGIREVQFQFDQKIIGEKTRDEKIAAIKAKGDASDAARLAVMADGETLRQGNYAHWTPAADRARRKFSDKPMEDSLERLTLATRCRDMTWADLDRECDAWRATTDHDRKLAALSVIDAERKSRANLTASDPRGASRDAHVMLQAKIESVPTDAPAVVAMLDEIELTYLRCKIALGRATSHEKIVVHSNAAIAC